MKRGREEERRMRRRERGRREKKRGKKEKDREKTNEKEREVGATYFEMLLARAVCRVPLFWTAA